MRYTILAENIHKTFGTIEVLKGIDIQVPEGCVYTVMGASGAGKSTLLHILGTLDRQDRGKVRILEYDVDSMNDNELAEFRNQKIGFVFQFHHLLPEFTALENVCIPAFIGKVERTKALKKAEKLLDYFELSHRKNHKPGELSGGEQQRIAVARALINDPAIIFADEPSGNLDSKASDELHHFFIRMKKELNQTFLIVTHNPDLAKLSDRVLTIHDGRIIDNK